MTTRMILIGILIAGTGLFLSNCRPTDETASDSQTRTIHLSCGEKLINIIEETGSPVSLTRPMRQGEFPEKYTLSYDEKSASIGLIWDGQRRKRLIFIESTCSGEPGTVK